MIEIVRMIFCEVKDFPRLSNPSNSPKSSPTLWSQMVPWSIIGSRTRRTQWKGASKWWSRLSSLVLWKNRDAAHVSSPVASELEQVRLCWMSLFLFVLLGLWNTDVWWCLACLHSELGCITKGQMDPNDRHWLNIKLYFLAYMLGCITLQLQARHNFLDAPSFTMVSAASGSYRWVVGMLFQTSLWGRTLPLLPQFPLFDGFDVMLHVTRVKHAILHRLLQATGCYALSSDTCGLNLKTKTLKSSCFTTLTPLRSSFQEISGLRLWNVGCRMSDVTRGPDLRT